MCYDCWLEVMYILMFSICCHCWLAVVYIYVSFWSDFDMVVLHLVLSFAFISITLTMNCQVLHFLGYFPLYLVVSLPGTLTCLFLYVLSLRGPTVLSNLLSWLNLPSHLVQIFLCQNIEVFLLSFSSFYGINQLCKGIVLFPTYLDEDFKLEYQGCWQDRF